MRVLDKFEEWVISLMLLLMTALSFTQVVLRYVFNGGFTWALELTTVFFAIMIFVGISYGVRVGAHIGVDALVKLLPERPRRAVAIVSVLLIMVYVGLVLSGSYVYVSKMAMVGIELEDMPIERWKVLAVMPFGYALVGFRFLQIFYKLVTGHISSLSLADEAADAMHLRAQDDAFETTGARS
ncbi:MAG: TRAP transporter small permease [Burkholderiaceae bacterium]|jgi:C4-dicarboxylate transporter, DctQ subunit|nr:TRAP transporter small permease [Burkholderiaceae bacterium]